MSATKLFRRRLCRELGYQWGVVRSVIDWTILLYLLLPALAIAPFLYVDYWRRISVYWNGYIPVWLTLTLILILTAGGNIRTWQQDADLIFLLQRQNLLYRLKQWGWLTSLLHMLLVDTLVLVLAAPLLSVVYRFSSADLAALFLIVCTYNLAARTMRKYVDGPLLRRLFGLLLFLAASLLLFIQNRMLWSICGMIGLAALIILNEARLPKTCCWRREMEIESEAHRKWIRLILRLSTGIEKPVAVRARPLFFFRHSGRLFLAPGPINGLLELLLKTFCRNHTYRSAYFGLISITCLALVVLPVWLKWIVYGLFILFIDVWLKSVFRQMTAAPFFRVVPFDPAIAAPTFHRFARWLDVPAIVLTGVVAGCCTLLNWLL
ncbi:MAG: ABC transporter permease [Sporolactobacillus sp.]|nr:ABC transporter permease [Sporolactobacillus sp.]